MATDNTEPFHSTPNDQIPPNTEHSIYNQQLLLQETTARGAPGLNQFDKNNLSNQSTYTLAAIFN